MKVYPASGLKMFAAICIGIVPVALFLSGLYIFENMHREFEDLFDLKLLLMLLLVTSGIQGFASCVHALMRLTDYRGTEIVKDQPKALKASRKRVKA